MTKDEALELALEYMNERLEDYDSKFMRHRATEAKRNIILANIKEVKEALAQPAQEPVAMRYDYDGYGYKYIDSGSGSDWQTRIKDAEPIYTTPPAAQPAQEPVAWGYRSKDGEICDCISPEAHADAEGDYTVPLYTTPPLRPWVGLAADKIEDIEQKIYTQTIMKSQPQAVYLFKFAKAIEAAVKGGE